MARFELRASGEPCKVEPQVFSLIALLVENRERLVSATKSSRRSGTGASSRTPPSRAASSRPDRRSATTAKRSATSGRFIAWACDSWRPSTRRAAILQHESSRSNRSQGSTLADRRRDRAPSIAVLPFRLVGDAGTYAAIADALPHELITELSRLRWLFVTARGSSFRLRDPDADMARSAGCSACAMRCRERLRSPAQTSS